MAFGVYIHFPFCQQRCPYCDFAVAVRKQIPHDRYLRAIQNELAQKKSLFPGRRAVSVYLGGGTPSLWRTDCVATVCREVLAAFPSPEGVSPEITLECDPHGATAAGLAAFRAAGVTRLSIGAQSFEPQHLIQLGRQHRPDEISALVGMARAAGFANLSLDLMIGLAGQSASELDRDLARLVAVQPEHVSLYQLTVEPGTALAASIARGRALAPDPDQQAAAYDRVRSVLAQAGFRHYEISSFARAGSVDYRAVHNRLYWTGGEYLGLGVSAHSFRRLESGDGERFANTRKVETYLRLWSAALERPSEFPLSDGPGVDLYELRPRDALAREALWLGLRALDGVSCSRFAQDFGEDPRRSHGETLAKLVARGLVELDGEVLRLSHQGALWADEVGAALI